MIDAIIVGTYILAVLCIGMYFSRGVKSMKEFSLSNRIFPTPVIMATISATFIGAEFIFGFAEQTFNKGLIFLFPLIGLILCKYFIAESIVPRVARFSNAISVGDIMAEDYGKGGRIITGICAALLSVGFVGAQIAACGVLFKFFFDLPYVIGILIGCGVVVIYSTLGGFRAVAFTDLFQFAVLMVAVPIICDFELSKLGGFTKLFEALPSTHLMPNQSLAFEQIAWFFIFFIPLLDPSIMQRIFMDRDSKKVARAFKLSALADIPVYLILCIIGLIAVVNSPDIEPNLAFPHIMSGLPAGISGLAIAGVLAAIMSTADSFLNVASISLIHDVVKPLYFKEISERSELRMAQASSAVLGIFAIGVALNFPQVLDLIIYFMNISWVPLIVAPLYGAIYGLRANFRTFIFSGAVGISCQLLWPVIFGKTPEIVLSLLTLLASAFGLLLGHGIFGKKWPRLGPIMKACNLSFALPIKELSLRKILFIPRSIFDFSKKRVEQFGASYSLFGLFAVLNYIIPYFMWSSSNTDSFGLHLGLRFIAAGLTFLLIIHEYWPIKLQRFLPIYWHFTLLYCLPFFTTFMVLDNGCTTFWLCNVVLALFLLALLVDWLSLTIILTAGAFLGYSCFLLFSPHREIFFDRESFYIVTYMYAFAIIIGILFSRRNEKIHQEKMEVSQSLAASIAHEMRTPLATILINAQHMTKFFPKFAEGYGVAKSSGLTVPDISPFEHNLLKQIPTSIELLSKNSQKVIDMLLVKVSKSPASPLTFCSVASCVDKAISNYPLTPVEATKIHWEQTEDFHFLGNEDLFIHVLFNLIKNSLRATASLEDAKISIWINKTHGENALHVKDNGTGIAKQVMPNIFEHFITDTENGTGMGLAFCKMVMKSFKGEIICKSDINEGTEFILSFPHESYS